LVGAGPGAAVVLEYARAQYSAQTATFDALDNKTATVIAASLVLIGLVLPNFHARGPEQIALAGLFLVVIGYGLVAAFMAYRLRSWHVGVPAQDVLEAMPKEPGIAQGAIGFKLLTAYVVNKATMQRKAAFVQRGLLGLAASIVPLVALLLPAASSER
jgi:hypothetical protein